MERPTDELVERLLTAAAAAPADGVRRLVAQARAEAEAEVKDLVKTALKAVLLRRAVRELESSKELDPAEVEPVPPADDSPLGCYVYAIAAGPVDAPGLPGVYSRGVVRTMTDGELTAVISDVPLSEFGPEAVGERASDLAWVEQKVRAHDAVIKAVAIDHCVIPCRFCTILSGEDEVRRLLTEHREALSNLLQSLRGRREWGVKATTAPAEDPAGGPGTGDDAGRAYLAQRARRHQLRSERNRGAEAAAAMCHEQLAAAAERAAQLPVRQSAEAAPGERAVLNAAYLVPDDAADSFHKLAAALARQVGPLGLRLEVTGPWPPYNFARIDLSLRPQPGAESADKAETAA